LYFDLYILKKFAVTVPPLKGEGGAWLRLVLSPRALNYYYLALSVYADISLGADDRDFRVVSTTVYFELAFSVFLTMA
jgi:hypothetical protein